MRRSRWTRGYKAWICGRSLAVIAGSNPAEEMDACPFVNAVCCQVKVSATADPSSRVVLPSVVCLGVTSKKSKMMWPRSKQRC
jgi:hypothetical protein